METRSVSTMSVIYYNSAYTNGESTARPAIIRESRNSAIIEKPGEWQASVVRFDVSTNSIPVAVIKQTGFPLGAATDCFVTLTYMGIDYTQNVLLTKSQTENFNFVYSYQHWLDNINTAFATAFAAIPGPPANQGPPIFVLDDPTSLIRMYVTSDYLMTLPNPITISVNDKVYRYLQGFQAFFNGNNTVNFKDYDLYVLPNNTFALPAAGARSSYPVSVASANYLYYCSQEKPNLGSWNPVRSLVISSELLPLRPEFVQANINNNIAYGLTGNYRPILTDFIQDQSSNPASRGVTVYLPTAEYRMIDLFGDNALYNIDMQISWTDFEGNIYPIMLAPGETFGVKLMFRRRG